MSRSAWLAFRRDGGLPPSDDEALALGADGTFTARRTVGGRAIGSFEGQLRAATVRRLTSAVDALSGPASVTIPTPRHGATELIKVAGHSLQLCATERPPAEWRALVQPLRKAFETEVIEHPRAAVQLAADAETAALGQAGATPIDVDLGTLRIRVVHRGADDGIRGRWSGRPDALVDNGETMVAVERWITAGKGWSADLPFDHGFDLAPKEWLQVWVDLSIRADGERRAGQLYRPVIPDA